MEICQWVTMGIKMKKYDFTDLDLAGGKIIHKLFSDNIHLFHIPLYSPDSDASKKSELIKLFQEKFGEILVEVLDSGKMYQIKAEGQRINLHPSYEYSIEALDFLNLHYTDCFMEFSEKGNQILNIGGASKPLGKMESLNFILPSTFYPYLLVQFGEKTEFVEVCSSIKYEKLDESGFGRTYLLGMMKLITHYHNLSETVTGSSLGDNSHVDMTVGQIYGSGYEGVGLPSEMIASSFACSKPTHSDSDRARSLLLLVYRSIFLQSFKYINNISRIIFVGNNDNFVEYLKHYSDTLHRFSQGSKTLLFTPYSSYLQLLGYFLQKQFHSLFKNCELQ